VGGLLSAAPASAQWQVIEPGGETRCSDGSPYRFFVHPGDPARVLVEFEGGGGCWDALTCASPIYTRRVEVDPERARQLGLLVGIYDRTNPANPVRDWTHVYIPYCTGDLHWGAVTRTYAGAAGPLTIEHRGAVNASSALDWVFANVPSPTNVFVTGCSAGGYGAIFWAPRVFARYPAAARAHLSDSSAGITPPGFFAVPFENWNVAPAWPSEIPALAGFVGDPGRVTMPDLYAAIGAADPGASFAQWNAQADATQIFFWNLMRGGVGGESDWSGQMMASLSAIRGTTPNFHSYLAPGTQHCVINTPSFYTTTVAGRPVADWVRALVTTGAPGSVP
jgi:hypothetical protein